MILLKPRHPRLQRFTGRDINMRRGHPHSSPDNMPQVPTPPGAKFMGLIFGVVFGGIGLTVLIFMIFAGSGFGSPPLFFRIVASFIALAFIGVGGTTVYGMIRALKNKGNTFEFPPNETHTTRSGSPQAPPSPGGPKQYSCPSCGAPLGADLEVSPHGDAKCSFCSRWFNIHGK